MEDKVNKDDIFQYTFHNEDGTLTVVLDEDYIKQIFKADYVLLDEKEHR